VLTRKFTLSEFLFRVRGKIMLFLMNHGFMKNFHTIHLRPVYANAVTIVPDEEKITPPVAIVIQGPIKKERNFTFETVKIYKKHFPDATIILSTWEGEKIPAGLDCEILLNKKPAYQGHTHINMQIESTKNGMMRAKELGFKYVIKTRTDQRIYAPNVKEFLFNLINTFPLKHPVQKQRLITPSLFVWKNIPYSLHDMWMFGTIDDMLLYWSPEYDNRTFDEYKEIGKNPADPRGALYFNAEFLKKLGMRIDMNPKASWELYAKHFCIIDKEMIDLYWGKYNDLEFPNLHYYPHGGVEISFKDWFNLYCALGNQTRP
jgi:hypothetical protein